jgi:4-amino-4-deoxy-L-arabinose transferase-like glycosyltransferase
MVRRREGSLLTESLDSHRDTINNLVLGKGTSLKFRPYTSFRAWRPLGAIVVSALLLRLFVLFAVQPTPLAGDENDYFLRAAKLVEAGRILDPGERAPLTEIFYAGLFRVFEADPNVARAGNAVLSALTLVPVFILGRCFGAGHGSGVVAAALAALYPNFIAFSHYLWSETLYLFLVTWALALLALHADRASLTCCLLAGGVLGLAALTREVGVLFPFLAAAWLYCLSHTPRHTAATYAASLLAAAILVVFPWTLYLNQSGDDFALVTRTTNLNLYLGNPSPVALAGRAEEVEPQENYWRLGHNRVTREREAGRLAMKAIAERLPWWPLEKIVEQLPRFFTPTSFVIRRLLVPPAATGPDRDWSYRVRETLPDSRSLRWLGVAIVVASYIGIALAGTVGLVLGERRRLALLFALFIAAQLLPTVLTFAASRFRLATELVFVVAAASLRRWEGNPFATADTARRWGALGAAAALLLVILSRFGDALRSDWG